MEALKLIDKELGEQRISICRSCPAMQIQKLDPSLGLGELFGLDISKEYEVCGEFGRPMKGISCGCILAFKTPIKIFNCPQKKWMKQK